MEKVDVLLQVLEPAIEEKCAEIRQKKRESFMTKIFISVAVLMLTVPATLVFFGVSVFAILMPILFVGAVFLAASPILMGKGAESIEQVSYND